MTSTTRGPGSGRRIERQLARFDKVLARSGGALDDGFGTAEATAMRREMLTECRHLIPQLPDIGGRDNPLAGDLVEVAWALAAHRVLLRHGGSTADTGELLHRVKRTELERTPRRLRPLITRVMFSWLGQRVLERGARRSQARRYPDDWVAVKVDGDGASFDFGMDVTQCAVVRFLHAQGTDDLTPYLCDLDWVRAEVMGYGLARTKTLAWGCDRCDFRFTRKGATSAPWPPRFVERTCGQATAAEPTRTPRP